MYFMDLIEKIFNGNWWEWVFSGAGVYIIGTLGSVVVACLARKYQQSSQPARTVQRLQKDVKSLSEGEAAVARELKTDVFLDLLIEKVNSLSDKLARLAKERDSLKDQVALMVSEVNKANNDSTIVKSKAQILELELELERSKKKHDSLNDEITFFQDLANWSKSHMDRRVGSYLENFIENHFPDFKSWRVENRR